MNATQNATDQTTGPVLGAAALAVHVVSAAAATSTSYVLQPELRVVAADLGSSVSRIGAQMSTLAARFAPLTGAGRRSGSSRPGSRRASCSVGSSAAPSRTRSAGGGCC